MIDYRSQPIRGFIKYVEFMPEWMKPYFPGVVDLVDLSLQGLGAALRCPLLYLCPFHPGCLTIEGGLPVPPGGCRKAGLIDLIQPSQRIFPENPPPGFTLPQPQPNQLYGRQITRETPAGHPKTMPGRPLLR